jgi:hypothetical protein
VPVKPGLSPKYYHSSPHLNFTITPSAHVDRASHWYFIYPVFPVRLHPLNVFTITVLPPSAYTLCPVSVLQCPKMVSQGNITVLCFWLVLCMKDRSLTCHGIRKWFPPQFRGQFGSTLLHVLTCCRGRRQQHGPALAKRCQRNTHFRALSRCWRLTCLLT